jgi:hypothetical protein
MVYTHGAIQLMVWHTILERWFCWRWRKRRLLGRNSSTFFHPPLQLFIIVKFVLIP